ncbi:class I SAM-dependent methyltransferase [Methylobacterium crusticola]|uniref:class I SAM-dependent methyltransferase n=1 Tax=Methylobacterium crusticola TaxID=1697972 RepID=UPI000FFBB385|nr:class I SAM-dependent methyltransferase [Methylobacterium crusticola]
MDRASVSQQCLNLLGSEGAYLEVGVNRGVTFHNVSAAVKVAVDPHFLFDVADAELKNQNATYRQITSDAYFLDTDRRDRFDVIFLDGLHTVEQTLRDLMNATEVLKDPGIIIIDDVIPSSYAASLPSIPDAEMVKAFLNDQDASWMGDVYRLVWFIDTFMPTYTYRCVEENHGQLIMWRHSREASNRSYSLSEIGSLSFCEMIKHRETFNIKPMVEILNEIRGNLMLAGSGA